MKKLTLIVGAVCLLALLVPSTFAKGKGGGKKSAAPQPVASDVYAKYDKNSNGTLDADEKEAICKDLAAGDAALKAYDVNGDNKLSDDEIAAIPATKAADAPVKGKGKKKNK